MGDTLLPHFGHITEFITDPITGQHWNGTCTQTALEVCIASLEQRSPSIYHVAQIARDMVKNNLAGANGAATIANLAKYARALGFKTIVEWDYQGDTLAQDWHTLLLQHVGILPIVMQIANGQALVDAETGAKDEVGLHYHAIALGGKQVHGYICADGDNPQVATRNQIYTIDTLVAAKPCGLIMLSN